MGIQIQSGQEVIHHILELTKKLFNKTLKKIKMKNIIIKFWLFYLFISSFCILFSIDLYASSLHSFKLKVPQISSLLSSILLNSQQDTYNYALDYYKKGNPEAAINLLNTNYYITSIVPDNALIYKAYKLIIACYKSIDKDGNAQASFETLCAAVKKDQKTVQQILDNTAL